MKRYILLIVAAVLGAVAPTAQAQCYGGGHGANFNSFSGGYGFSNQVVVGQALVPSFSTFGFLAPQPVIFNSNFGGFANVNVIGGNRRFGSNVINAQAGGGGGFANVNVVNQRGGLFGRRNTTIVNAQAGGGGGGVANVNVVNSRRRK